MMTKFNLFCLLLIFILTGCNQTDKKTRNEDREYKEELIINENHTLKEKPYKIFWDNNELFLQLPQDYSDNGSVRTPRTKFDYPEIVAEIFNELKKNTSQDFVNMWIILNCYDKYGNKTIHTKEYELGTVKIQEVKKYQNVDFFDDHYRITNNIKAALVDSIAGSIREDIESVERLKRRENTIHFEYD